jgi:DNA-binding CsgD family transcriptional regulator
VNRLSRDADVGQEFTEVAASADPLPRRAEQLVTLVRRVMPYDGAWLALTDPDHARYSPLVARDLADPVRVFLAGSTHARDIEVAGLARRAPPRSVSDAPYPAEEIETWAECLLPAGYQQGIAVALFAGDGRHVGFFAGLWGDPEPPGPDVHRLLARLTPLLSQGIDPMRSLTAAAGLVRAASAGVVLHADGGIVALPGLGDDALLAAGSPVLGAARAAIEGGAVYRSFLWPRGGDHAPWGHARITALARSTELPVSLLGIVLVSPVGDLRGLSPRELQVLGLVVEGCSNRQIARQLVITVSTVAAHMENILAKLAVPSRTLAATRAERTGLYVPRQDVRPDP